MIAAVSQAIVVKEVAATVADRSVILIIVFIT